MTQKVYIYPIGSVPENRAAAWTSTWDIRVDHRGARCVLRNTTPAADPEIGGVIVMSRSGFKPEVGLDSYVSPRLTR